MFRISKNLIIAISIAIFIQVDSFENLKNVEIRWDWNLIEPIKVENLQFQANFMLGVSTSSHQVEGNCNCQWTNFEKKKHLEESDIACDHWNRYKNDIQLIKQLGAKAYRFSIEWSKVEPLDGEFDEIAIQHYHDLINELIANDIAPVITLHHFTHPQWFEDIGAFEKEKNIEKFVRYCKKMFLEFSNKVPMWCTINEPGVYAFQGYMRGVFPPGKKDLEIGAEVSKNLIIAHITTYKELKKMENGDKVQIGITHSIIQYDPYHKNNAFESYLSSHINHIFYDAILQFFVTGKFTFKAPTILQLILSGSLPISFSNYCTKINFKYYVQTEFEYASETGKYKASEIVDFIGVQPYSHVLINWKNPTTKPSLRSGDLITDMPYCIYPESLYRAINQASFIGVPIYITENGIADAKDDRRELFIRRYLYALKKAIDDGYDVRGYFYWSLLDNYEWDFGFSKKFGLYEVNFKSQERTLRKGSEFYKKILDFNNNSAKTKSNRLDRISEL